MLFGGVGTKWLQTFAGSELTGKEPRKNPIGAVVIIMYPTVWGGNLIRNILQNIPSVVLL